jgi:methionyl aminopeptidase
MTILGEILDNLASRVIEGATGNDLERYAELLMQIHEVEPAFKGYQPKGFSGAYPNILCVSINGEVIHGLPDDRKFEDGDVVKIDCGTKDRSHGQYDDGATTVIVGRGSAAARRLVKGTREALEAAVALAKPGATTDDLAAAIEAVAKRYELAVIHGYGGHGIGTELHMEPFIPNEVVEGVPSVELVAGQRIAIEPMFSTNRGETYVDKNGWTIKIRGGGLAAHFERTVVL